MSADTEATKALAELTAAVKPICQWWTVGRPLTSEDHDALADAFAKAVEVLGRAAVVETPEGESS